MKEDELQRAEERLRAEFNRWAAAGRGDDMEQEHAAIAAGMLAQMEFRPDDKILDLGCGAGWLAALLAERVPEGQVVGMDVADDMVRRARKKYAGQDRLLFVIAGAEDIPWDDNFFNKVISIESAYYWPDPLQGFREIHRVLQPGGTVHTLINLYQENVYSHQWRDLLTVPTHLLSGDGWCERLRQAGFERAGHSRVVDPRPVPAGRESRWFAGPEDERRFRQEGALLVVGEKASVTSLFSTS